MKKADDPGAIRKKLEDYSYVLNHNIGKGYSSQVFRGRNDLTEETVAIKVIDMKLIKGEVHKNLLASEIEVLKTLKNCDNIIEVYDIYNTKNNTYIITELCDGGDLSKLIANKRTLPETHAIALMTQIINGYVNFHSRGIIHRDLKPANIFLRSNTVKIADFGFAMKCSDGKKYSSYNVGSPVYMPPEALNENKYSFKSDIWALGVIYYEMLTGKTPWRAKTEKELAKLMLSVPIKKLLPPSISQSSENFLLRTLTLDINERMSPEELQRFQLSSERSSNPSHLYSTEGTVFDGRNNSIRRNEMGKPAERQLDRHDTSLNKHSLTNQFQLKKATLLQSEEFKTNTMLKTAATISNKTEHFIANSNQQIPHVDNSLTQKDISLFQSKDASYDRKYLSKQLLSQIHLCRFLFKLILRIGEKLPPQTNQELQKLKECMVGLIFNKLDEVEHLRALPAKMAQDFKVSSDYQKIYQIIEQYQAKYSKELSSIRQVSKGLPAIKEELTKCIIGVYQSVDGEEDIEPWKEEIVVLDYLVTLRQLIGLLLNNDLEGFHNKSKIETIVEGAPSKHITHQHLTAIRTKLKAMKVI